MYYKKIEGELPQKNGSYLTNHGLLEFKDGSFWTWISAHKKAKIIVDFWMSETLPPK